MNWGDGRESGRMGEWKRKERRKERKEEVIDSWIVSVFILTISTWNTRKVRRRAEEQEGKSCIQRHGYAIQRKAILP